MFEVEVKAPADGLIEKKVAALGKYVKKEVQTDTYFQHPCRDFRKTDEAFRVRAAGKKFYLTYKGPKAKSDLKIRREIEFPVSEKIYELLTALGFTRTLVVKKTRKYYSIRGLEVALDNVTGLGRFIEIESREAGSEKKIMQLAKKLGIKEESITTKSYSELIEEKT
jgi:adenylate cyclase class 2